jgi:hypothetical protein
MSLLYQLLGVPLIDSIGLALTLPIRAETARVKGALVGIEPAPGEAIENILFGTRYIAALVGVFDTEDKLALVLSGEKIIV